MGKNVNDVAVYQDGSMLAVAGNSFVHVYTVHGLSLSIKWAMTVCDDLKAGKNRF